MSEVVGENQHFDQALLWVDRGLMEHPLHQGLLLKKASILIDGYEDIDEAFGILSKLKLSFSGRTQNELKKDLGQNLLLDIYLLLVDCYRLKSAYQEAHIYAQLSREIAPFDENALLALATAEFQLGRYREAERMINL